MFYFRTSVIKLEIDELQDNLSLNEIEKFKLKVTKDTVFLIFGGKESSFFKNMQNLLATPEDFKKLGLTGNEREPSELKPIKRWSSAKHGVIYRFYNSCLRESDEIRNMRYYI